MCLGVPGRVTELLCQDGVFASARVEFVGVSRICSMACVPEVQVGDYVVVHAGIAISRIDETAAQQTLQELSEQDLLEELEQMQHGHPADGSQIRQTGES